MTMQQNSQFVVAQLLKVTAKEARYLERTAARLGALNIDLTWVKSLENSDEHSEMLDAFVSRYGRLQDTLGDKLLPAMLRAGLEKTGSQLDNLLRAEKLVDSLGRKVDRTTRASKPFDARIHGVARRPVKRIATSLDGR
jgi:hypothetical protein